MAEQEALIVQFAQSQSGLQNAVDGLSEQRASEVWCGTWGVKQIVAHIAGWESAMAEALQKIARGERPSVEGIDLNDTDGTNARFAERAASGSFADAVDNLRAAGDRLTAAIRALPDDRIEEGRTARRIVETMVGHPGEHIAEIREWRQKQGA